MCAFILLAIGFYYMISPVSTDTTPVLFSVPHGTSVSQITESLASESLIRSASVAYYITRFSHISLKAGTYKLSPAQSTLKILAKISEGKQEYTRVTIPEGLSLLKTAKHLEEAGILTSSDFLEAARNTSVLEEYNLPGKNAEGFLFPDTYFFPYKSDAKSVVRIMVKTFFEKTSLITNVPKDPVELYNKVILASIIEREYQVSSEAPMIASVFVNRIKIGMGLQSCATIEYILTELQNKPHPTRLTNNDLAIQSDYNTYLWAGLPPGPISSPGIVALDAAFNPADTKFLYFRLTDSENGTHSFTYSLNEHVKAGKQLMLKKAAGN